MALKLPFDFEERVRHSLGNEFDAFQNSLGTNSPVSIRLNPQKKPSIAGEKIPWCANGLYLDARPKFTLDPELHGGCYYVQEASSMFLEQAISQSIDLNQSLKVLDLCGAPGGKSTHILSLINQNSLLISNEVIRSRASILSENVQKWGYLNSIVTNNDPKDFNKLKGYFDLTVVDAPCSGEGLFRKDTDAMKEWSTKNVALCSLRQQRILEDVFPTLKENGILIYSTCTYNEDENENNLIKFSKENEVEFIELEINPAWGIEIVRKENVIGYRFYPHRLKGEGFFISVMKKLISENAINPKLKTKLNSPPKKLEEQVNNWIRDTASFQVIQESDRLIAIPKKIQNDIQYLSEKLQVISKGISMAEIKHDKLIPEQSLALSIQLNKDWFPQVDLSLQEALIFLKKETLSIETERKGFNLVTYNRTPLGWINVLENRINNLYPSNWRIRMDINTHQNSN
jgi:16S rRNA C967 or C1407 C5-methylase (RsmB/RsmF family)/NOL1/NOP2/fmu family ribosome biogenesis protein